MSIKKLREQLEDLHDDAVSEFKASEMRSLLFEVQILRASAWREGYYAGKRDYAGSITAGQPMSTQNPYE